MKSKDIINVRKVSFLLALLLLTGSRVGGQVRVHGSVYGGGALANANIPESGDLNTATVNLTGGIIDGDVYGGGLGQLGVEGKEAVAALVGKTVVNLNGTKTEETTTDTEGNETKTVAYKDNCVVKGCIFGCNNLNGTPKGSVTVHVYKTQGYEGHQRTTGKENLESIDDSKHSYELKAVYGGGNLAAYEPTTDGVAANVIIDGCDLTSIKQVYGGGNAASTPATQVDIRGTYEIEEVFGGGNGKDDITKDGGTTYIKNPGANVGFRDYSEVEDTYDTKEKRQGDDFKKYVYGSGEARVNFYGGRVHRVFGGSNTKGNVRITAVTMLEDEELCDFKVDEAYGGGKSAPMDGATQLLMSCIPGLKVAYGGAEEANVLGNVTLNITNGEFDRVFGGNNVSGSIGGTITVNVEETGCRPVIIGQLYGGGNQAPYTAPAGEPGPTVNVRSFTSIGEVYGGGYGKTATVTGNTTVNINECEGKYKDQTMEAKTETISFYEYVRTDDGGFETTDDGERTVQAQSYQVYLPDHAEGKIGAINNVYGGGNAAMVVGDTHVNIGTKTTETFASLTDNEATGDVDEREKPVLGVDIRGNVYGGGNQAEVTGKTNVVIGRKSE